MSSKWKYTKRCFIKIAVPSINQKVSTLSTQNRIFSTKRILPRECVQRKAFGKNTFPPDKHYHNHENFFPFPRSINIVNYQVFILAKGLPSTAVKPHPGNVFPNSSDALKRRYLRILGEKSSTGIDATDNSNNKANFNARMVFALSRMRINRISRVFTPRERPVPRVGIVRGYNRPHPSWRKERAVSRRAIAQVR